LDLKNCPEGEKPLFSKSSEKLKDLTD